MQLTRTIIVECWPLLEVEVERFNKRALRLGCNPLTLSKSDPYLRASSVNGVNQVDHVYDVVIDGEPLKLNGWRFLARVEGVPGADNLLFAAPGERPELFPEEFRKCSAFRCQHCNQERQRKFTWLVKHDDGSYRQVGSSCMDDFLKAKSPERAVTWWMGSMDKLIAHLLYLEQQSAKQVTTGYRPPLSGPMLVVARDVLVKACQVVRVRGGYEFASDTTESTSSWVWRGLFSEDPVYAAAPEQQDIELADKVIAYVATQVGASDYFRNLGITFAAAKVSVRNLKLISSAVYAYQRSKRPAPAVKNEHVGSVGDRLRDLELKVVYVLPLTSAYHETYDYMLIMTDSTGRTFKWVKTSAGSPPAKGDKVKVTGTVVRHETYKGTKQTILQRCALAVLQAA